MSDMNDKGGMSENKQTKITSGLGKRLKYGSFATIMGAAVVAVAILLNLFMTLAESRFGLNIDLTANRLYSLTDDTRAVLDGLKEPVTIYTLFSQGKEDAKVQEALALFEKRSKHVTVTNVDPIRNPGFVTKFDTGGSGVGSGSIIVSNSSESRYKLMYASELYDVSAETYTVTGLKVESKVASAVAYVTGTDLPTVYFLQGHQEPSIITDMYYLRDALLNNGYEAEVLNYSKNTPELSFLDVIVVVSPQTDLTEMERDALLAHLEKGGKAIFLMDVSKKTLTNFNQVMSAYGIDLQTNLVRENDDKRYYQNNAILVPFMEMEEITTPIMNKNLTVLMPGMRSMKMPDRIDGSILVMPLLTSSSNSFAKSDPESTDVTQKPEDETGPFTLAAYAYRENKTDAKRSTKLVVIGNASFITSSNNASIQGNFELFMQSVFWMQDRTDAVAIRTKSLTAAEGLNITTLSEVILIFVVVVIAVPLVILVFGAVVWFRRRHL